jgi:hypothetical protein
MIEDLPAGFFMAASHANYARVSQPLPTAWQPSAVGCQFREDGSGQSTA